ncbi:HAUS augmin-like complex subunit 6 [Denticeps clupeoides]|uniref:HAUS augmin-like complex subunit 6 N-terminal domain-containing protein n=1 Tax=Denticeps clupeoides TaxID=299321 RepID=A0AAY4A1J9_9TELE|nr:HAUS augmin-like complex subunit 6 [Denticeps clupeoides]
MCSLQKENSKYLWWYLLSLGFQPDVAANIGGISKSNLRRPVLAGNMFEKPNKEAFYIVTHFLLDKLNPSRTRDEFRCCWPVLDPKTDAEFRKVTFAWLQEIANEPGSVFPKILASYFLSPGGPKFIQVMLSLAKHVMLQEMKTFSTDGSWIPEAAAVPATSLQLELKRFQLVKRHFERAAVDQDRVIREYQHRAQILEKSIHELRADDSKYTDLLKHLEKIPKQETTKQLDMIQQVRSIWEEIEGILSTLEEERRVVDCVIQGHVDQYTLDGKDMNLKIPTILLERMEKLSHLSSMGKMYESGQPVFLRLLEILNEAVGLFSEERSQIVGPTAELRPETLQEKVLALNCALDTLKNMRRKLVKEAIPKAKSSIKQLEADWDKKWSDHLKHDPLTSFLSTDPALDFLSPLCPQSINLTHECGHNPSIFSQYPAKLPELLSQEECPQENQQIAAVEQTSTYISSEEPLTKSAPTMGLQEVVGLLPKPVTPFGMLPAETHPPDVPVTFITPSPMKVSLKKNSHKQKTSGMKKKPDILGLEYDNLANQFAEAVISSPDDCMKGQELEQFLNSLSDPFTTRKQLPRTPESLIMDVRNSWRKAMEEGTAEKHHGSGKLSETSHVASYKEVCQGALLLSESVETGSVSPGCSPPVCQQRSLHSTLPWDSSHLEALDSQNSSELIKFNIIHETLPVLPSNDSLLSTDDDGLNFSLEKERMEDTNLMEHNELVLPLVLSTSLGAETPLQAARRRLQAILAESSFKDHKEFPQNSFPLSPLPTQPALGPNDKIFSLDLDQLESPSHCKELSLPNLVDLNFVDDLLAQTHK